MLVVGLLTGESFRSMVKSYAATSRAGPILLSFLGPAVIALACQMYDRCKVMQENMREVAAAITVSSVGGLFETALAVRWLVLTNPKLRLALLSRNITSPLAMAIAGILGADVSLAVSMVVVTGLIGANFGASILDFVGITDPVARGLRIGAAAHGLGTAAFANEKDSFPFAAIDMALTASSCTVLVSVPKVNLMLTKIALGL
jgi:putative effector of murein hydrolase